MATTKKQEQEQKKASTTGDVTAEDTSRKSRTQRSGSRSGPEAKFRVFRQSDGGIRCVDESTDKDGRIQARFWQASDGSSGRGRVFLIPSERAITVNRVQLYVVDDHHQPATVAMQINTLVEAEEIAPFADPPNYALSPDIGYDEPGFGLKTDEQVEEEAQRASEAAENLKNQLEEDSDEDEDKD